MARRKISVGGVPIGGNSPVTVQSMTNTPTSDVSKTVMQIKRLAEAGCDIVRVAVPDMASARAIGEIKRQVSVPIVADVHFDFRLAVAAAEAGADKIRINPGNIGGEDKVRAVVDACRARGIPIRVGVNGGSLEKDILKAFGGATPEALVESAMRHVRLLNKFGFDDVCISVKSSDVMTTVRAYRLLHELTDYPLHLGVTEAGTEYIGLVRSSVAIGALLAEGIGDTIRVSLTAPPEREVEAGVAILRALGLRRRGPELISCPTCGRCKIDLIAIAHAVEERLRDVKKDITVAVMGCAVNGPGEAMSADFGIAGGEKSGVLFRKGAVVKVVPADRLVDELFLLIESTPAEND